MEGQHINNLNIELGTCNNTELDALVGFYERRINSSMIALAAIEHLQQVRSLDRMAEEPVVPEQRDRNYEDFGGPAL